MRARPQPTDGSRAARRDGQSLVEFALVLAPLLFVVVAFVDVARGVYFYNSLSEAVRHGTRVAIVHGATSSLPAGPDSSCTDVVDNSTTPNQTLEDVVRSRLRGVAEADVIVSCTWVYNSNLPGTPVRIDAWVNFRPLLVEFWAGIPLRARSTMTIVY